MLLHYTCMIKDEATHDPYKECVAHLTVAPFISITSYYFSSQLNVSRTSGGDGVHPHVSKSCAGLLAYPLPLLFEKSLRTGDIPSPWQLSVSRYLKKYTFSHSKPFNKIVLEWSIHPIETIFKSGSRSSPTYYRTFSLTSVC